MKRKVTLVILFAVCLIISYVFLSFTFMDWNCAEWHWFGRVLLFPCAICSYAFAEVYSELSEMSDKVNNTDKDK